MSEKFKVKILDIKESVGPETITLRDGKQQSEYRYRCIFDNGTEIWCKTWSKRIADSMSPGFELVVKKQQYKDFNYYWIDSNETLQTDSTFSKKQDSYKNSWGLTKEQFKEYLDYCINLSRIYFNDDSQVVSMSEKLLYYAEKMVNPDEFKNIQTQQTNNDVYQPHVTDNDIQF